MFNIIFKYIQRHFAWPRYQLQYGHWRIWYGFFWKEFNSSPLLGYKKLPLFSDCKQTLSQVARWYFSRQNDPLCQLLRALAKSGDFLKFEQNTVIPDFGSNLKCLHSYLALRNWNISWFWHEKIKFLICFVFFYQTNIFN